jgi:hypothetical protein
MRLAEMRNGRWRGAGVVKVLLSLLVGTVLGAVLRSAAPGPSDVTAASRPAPAPAPGTPAPGGTETPAPTAGPGPRSSVSGVGVGFSQSEAGAVAAATSYATAGQSWLYLTDSDLTGAVQAVVASEAPPELTARLVTDVELLRDQLIEAPNVWYAVAPLATKVETYSATRSMVRVWVVRVLSADGVVVPQSGWQTLTFELVWERDASGASDWRVVDVTEAVGPTPQLEAGLQPWSAAYLAETLAGFIRVGVR